jgi:hypothetical protein
MIKKELAISMLCVFLIGCQGGGEQQSPATSQTATPSGPQIVKILIASPAQVDSLRSRGIDIIVVEENYVAARVAPQEEIAIQDLQLKTEPIQETELVQRLVRIPGVDMTRLQELVDLGIDVWEVEEDAITAQVFDSHIWEMQQRGFTVEILERNVQDVVKKAQK